MNRFKLLFSFIGLVPFNNTFAQSDQNKLASFIRQQIDSVYAKEKLPGIFVGVLNNGEKQFFNAGYANPETQLPFDSATLFEIGSITKTFTAYVLTAVLHDKKIPETDFIGKYLPEDVQQNKDLDSISFLSLMNHTSGLPRVPGNMKPAKIRQPYEDYTADRLFAFLKTCTPKPDGKSNYSNLGAGLAGILAERISGSTYAALLDRYIFLPFQMITPENAITITDNKSQGYYGINDKTEYWNMNILAPAGGLKCRGTEMLIYLHNMCLPQAGNSKNIIDKLTTQTIALNPKVAIGRGWFIFKEKGQPLFYWHNGGTFGFSTFCAFTKDKSKAVIVAINQFNKNALSDGLGIKIIKELLGEE